MRRAGAAKIAAGRIRVANLFSAVGQLGLRVFRALRSWGVTIVGLLAALVLQTGSRLDSMPTADSRTIFLAVGTLLGTMIVLAISLSVIPLQRAVSISTSLAVRLYRDDRVSARILAVLSLQAVASFGLALVAMPTRTRQILLSLQLAEVALAFDLLRLHFRRIARLLDIGTAVADARREAERLIRRTARMVSRRARLLKAARGRALARPQVELYEGAIYAMLGPFHRALVVRLRHLGETARRAVASGELHGALAALRAIDGICVEYVRIRRSNVRLLPVDLWVADSDLSILLSPALDEYAVISESAIAAHSEGMVKEVIESLGRLTIEMAGVSGLGARPGTAPLAYQPLLRLVERAKRAQTVGFDEAVWSAIGAVETICQSTPRDLSVESVHHAAIEALRDLALIQVAKSSAVIANRAVEALMRIAAWFVASRHGQLTFALKDILDSIGLVVRLSTTLGQDRERLVLQPPGSPAYDISKPSSLLALVRRSLDLIESGPLQPWMSRFREFVACNEEIVGHLRNVAREVHLGKGTTLTLILLTLKEIVRVYVAVLADETISADDRTLLENQVIWYTSFCWSAFREAETFRWYAAQEAVDLLSWTALRLWSSAAVPKAMLSSIKSIIDSSCEKGVLTSGFDLADLMMRVEHLRVLAEDQGLDEVAALATRHLEKPAACGEELWRATESALATRRDRFADDLSDPFRWSPLDTAERQLIQLLRTGADAARGEGDPE